MGGLHDSWFVNIETPITFLFAGRFRSNLYQIFGLEISILIEIFFSTLPFPLRKLLGFKDLENAVMGAGDIITA